MRQNCKVRIGEAYGRWTVVEAAPSVGGFRQFLCECICGVKAPVKASSLRNGRSKSCGCYGRETASAARRTHGMTRSPEYISWAAMRARVNNPESPDYPAYGGRGITICERWEEFDRFLEDMGQRPSPRHSIERVDNDAGYGPQNCIWALPSPQARNRRSNRIVTFNGEQMTLADAVEKLGHAVHSNFYKMVGLRLRSGWDGQRALTEPPRHAAGQYGRF